MGPVRCGGGGGAGAGFLTGAGVGLLTGVTGTVDRLKTSLYKDVSAALDGYDISRKLYAIDQRNQEVALLNQQISSEKYRNGTINSFDYRTVQNRLLVAVLNELQALANLIHTGMS